MLLYKYTPINRYYKDSLAKKYFFCSVPSKLNDPFDGYVPIKHEERDDFIRKWLNIHTILDNKCRFPFYTVKDVKNAYDNGMFDEYVYKLFFENNLDRFFVYSLSKIELSPLMWGIYAANGSGMCLCYKTKDFSDGFHTYYGLKVQKINLEKWNYFTLDNNVCYLNIHDVKYSEKRRIYNVIASETELCTNNFDAIDEFLIDSIKTKSPCWQNEKECRGVFHSNSRKKNYKLYYDEEILDSITFGYNSSERDIESIKKIIKKQYRNSSGIKFYKAERDFTTKTLKKIPLS